MAQKSRKKIKKPLIESNAGTDQSTIQSCRIIVAPNGAKE